VVQNLVVNAIKYGAPDAPVSVAWCRSSDEPDADLHLTVHNRGAPIPPELLPQIFEPFRSSERHDRQGAASMGLGLFIVREVVQAHGGRISVDSDGERGTTFHVTLPARAPGPVSAR
jgi:signal transduction histidine kinase